MRSGLLATCGPTHTHHHAAGSREALFAKDFFTVALIFDQENGHTQHQPPQEQITMLFQFIKIVAYTFSNTLTLISH